MPQPSVQGHVSLLQPRPLDMFAQYEANRKATELAFHQKALKMAAMFLISAFLKFYPIREQSKQFSPAFCPITYFCQKQ